MSIEDVRCSDGAAFHRGDADAEYAAIQPSGGDECLQDLWSTGEAGQ